MCAAAAGDAPFLSQDGRKLSSKKNKTDARARTLSLRTSGPWLCGFALVTMETAELEKRISASQAQILLIRKCF